MSSSSPASRTEVVGPSSPPGSPRRSWWRVLAARVAGPEQDELLRRTYLVRIVTAIRVAMVVAPGFNLVYAAAFHPQALRAAAVLSIAVFAAFGFLVAGIRRGWFDRWYSVAYFIFIGLIGNGDVAGMLYLTSGGAADSFLFAYFLLLLGLANLFPARLAWIAATAAATPVSFAAFQVARHGTLHVGQTAAVNLVLLAVASVVAVVANVSSSVFFLDEVDRRFHTEVRHRELVELDRAKTEFFANVTHDLRSPLTAVLGPLSSVLNDAGSGLSANHRKYLQLALRAAARLESMIDDLLELARIDAGVGRVHVSRVDLVDLVREQAQAFGPYAASLGLEIRFVSPPAPVTIDLDPGKIARVVMNLISNACKFSPRDSDVQVEVRETPAGAAVVVQDHGVGISPAERDRVFRRFERGSNARDVAGSGLGLAVIREFVGLHGGRVEVESAPGKGSTFTVLLPRVPTRGVGAAPVETRVVESRTPTSLLVPSVARLEPAPIRGRPRIVLADGDDELRRYMRLEFGEAYEIVEASDGEEALRLAESLPADLVIAEVRLTKVDGIELCRRLRAGGATRRIPAMLLTASDELETMLEGFGAGADDVVRKPFELLALWARVEALLRRSRLNTPGGPPIRSSPLGQGAGVAVGDS